MESIEKLDLSALAQTVTDTVAGWGLRVVGALVLLVLGWIASRAVRAWMHTALERSRLDNTLVPFVSKLVYYALLAFVLVAVLNLFGIQTASFIAVLGAAGLAVGLALQGTLSNFAAGVMLLLFRPFKTGDIVEAGGSTGKVAEIGIFATTLNSPDNVRIVVPNSSIYGQTVKNFTANDTRRNDLVVGIAYEDDIGTAIETMRAVLASEPRVLADPEPVVAVSELGDSSVNLVVRPWCQKDDYWPLRFDLTRRLKEELEAAGCSIPFPQTDVHLHQAAGERVA